MNQMNISDLVKAISLIIGLSIAAGKFGELREYALREGIKAVTYRDYKSTYFFRQNGRGHK